MPPTTCFTIVALVAEFFRGIGAMQFNQERQLATQRLNRYFSNLDPLPYNVLVLQCGNTNEILPRGHATPRSPLSISCLWMTGCVHQSHLVATSTGASVTV